MRERRINFSALACFEQIARKLIPQTANDCLLHCVCGSGFIISRGKNWFPLSSQLLGRKVSQFVIVKFFEIFPSEISRVRVADLWRENGEHVPYEWFGAQNPEEVYVITLFGICSGLLKLSSAADDEFLSSDVFKDIVDKINNLDVDDTRKRTQMLDRTPKTSQRIVVLEKELHFYRDKVKQIESAPLPSLNLSGKKMNSSSAKRYDSSLGPISKNAFYSRYGQLGTILGYGFIYGEEERQSKS